MFTTETAVAGDQFFQFPLLPFPSDRRWKSSTTTTAEHAPNCPRCASPNTKFCYYNNYSFSQPRYFCKGCRRYWTKGGSLRNVPVGGGCRKTRRSKSVRLRRNDAVLSDKNENNTVDEQSGTTNANDIDLAVVFAKFLNQNSDPEGNSSIEVSNCSNLDRIQAESMIDCQQQCDFAPIEFLGFEEGRNQELMAEDEINAFGIQNLLTEEEEVLWSDDAASLPNFTWPPPPLPLPPVYVDDVQLRNSTNLMSDNWGSFDLSGFEIFSAP